MPSIGRAYFSNKISAAIAAAQAREEAVRRGFTPPQATPQAPDPGVSVVMYGDADTIPVVYAAAGSLLVLPRPKVRRVLLAIFNTLAANPIAFAFNRPANNADVPVPAGGNAFFDNAVPQNDVYVFSPVAGTILVLYMNTN